MEFTQFEIKNFKGIKHIKLKLDYRKKTYVLIGVNESGKTSILEAINFFFNPLPKDERHILIPKKDKHNFKGVISVSADITFSDIDKKEIKNYLKVKGYKDVNISDKLKIVTEYKYFNSDETGYNKTWQWTMEIKGKNMRNYKRLFIHNEVHWNETTTFIENNLFSKVLYYPNFLFDFPERIYLKAEDHQTSEHKKYLDVIQDILSSIDPSFTIENNILNLVNHSSSRNSELLDLLLDKMSSKVTDIIFKAWSKHHKVRNKKIIIKINIENVDEKSKPYLQFKLVDNDDQFFISERSLGFRWFFSFLLFTEFRKNRTSDKSKVVFLLDEPASNLHPSAQINLLRTFEDLLDKSILIYTTHSHYLINPEWLNGTYIVSNKALEIDNNDIFTTNKTEIEITDYKQFISQYPNQREYFQPVLDILDHKPGLLEKIPSIIITEGKNDFFTFRYIQNIFLNNQYELNFYPGGGANSDEYIIRLYESWGRPYYLLRDSDAAGKKAVEKYKKSMPLFINDNGFSFADISAELDNKTLEDFFNDEEKLKITQVLSPSSTKYDKTKFNSSIHLLLNQKEKIELSEETLKRFELVFDFLQDKVSKR